jgi:heterodisulfide reductase subunit B
MKYVYYPGCSLKGSGRAYEESMLSVFKALAIPVEELNDWNCCGATAYMSISELKAFALSARNFALAEKQFNGSSEGNLVVPCAACYLGLNKTQHYLGEHPEIKEKVDEALEQAGLHYSSHVRIRHPLDVLLNDIGLERIKSNTKRPLTGLRVACYYGCQIVRPYAEFDNQHEPQSMDKILTALGAEVIDWPLKTRCCGGSLTGTIQEVGLRLSYLLLKDAKKRGCHVVATACPLCQFNLECYQTEMAKSYGEAINTPVAYFTQLMGVGLGLSPKSLGLNRLFTPLKMPDSTKAVQGGQYVHS